MGFVQLKHRMRHAIKPVFYAIIVIFLIGGAFSFTSYQRSRGPGGATGPRKVPKVVAEVNGQPIGRDQLDRFLWLVGRDTYHVPVESRRAIVTQFLESRIHEELMAQAQRNEGVRVSRKEIDAKRAELVGQFLEQEMQERKKLAEKLEREGISLEQYRHRIAQEVFGDDARIRAELAQEKLREKIQNQVQVSDEELRDSFTEVHARHILIDPKDLRSKAEEELEDEKAEIEEKIDAAREKGKEPDKKLQTKLSAVQVEEQALKARDWDAEAASKAKDLLAKVKNGANFEKLAKEHSSCPSASKGGDLDYFPRGMMAPEFEKAAFSMKPGEISDVVKTDFGYHIIKVEDRRDEVPEDFEKDKETYREDYIEQRKWRAWSQYQKELEDTAQIVVHDPELLAYRMLDEDGDEQKAMQLLERAVEQDPGNAGAMYELGQLWLEKDNKEQALALFLEAEKVETAEKSAQLMLSIGKVLQGVDRGTEAIEYYKKASDNAAALDPGYDAIHRQLETAFTELKRDDLAKQEAEWLERYQKAQEERGTGMPFGPGGTFTVE
jgi:peptidyl-prolyl cis-trans isomerase C